MTMPTRSTATELRQGYVTHPSQQYQGHFHVEPAWSGPSDGEQHRTVIFLDETTFSREMTFRVGNEGLIVLEPENLRTYDDDMRAQVSALWAEDWDSEEDAVYDDW